MWVKAIVLEDHGQIAVAGRNISDVPLADEDVALGRVLSPATMRMVVVFPQPEGPSKTMNSPSEIARDTLSTAVTEPQRLEMLARVTEAIVNRL